MNLWQWIEVKTLSEKNTKQVTFYKLFENKITWQKCNKVGYFEHEKIIFELNVLLKQNKPSLFFYTLNQKFYQLILIIAMF